jgi:hypothetical protein
MFNKAWRKKHKGQILTIGLVAALVTIGVIGIAAFSGSFSGLTNAPTAGEFDVIAWDGGRGIELPASSFSWTLYGVKGNDLTDFASFDVLTTGTSLADLGVSKLDTDYDQFVVAATGSVAKSWWDSGEPKIEPIDETYDHAYYNRWFVLNPSDVNYLIFYETPSETGLVVLDSQTIAPATAPVGGKTNLTLIVGTNSSQPFARYVTGANYADEANDAPTFEVNFNYAVALSDVSMNGATQTRINSTAIRFTFGVLSTTPSFYSLMWRADLLVTTEAIDQIYLTFGGTTLATFA